MTQRTKGLDISFWQDYDGTPQQIDFSKAVDMGTHFVIVRTSQDRNEDPDLEYNVTQAKKEGLATSNYHFLDYRVSASEQAKFFANLVKRYDPDFPAWLDVEQHRDWVLPPYANMIKAIKIFKDTYEDIIGKPLGFYTNPSMNKYYFGYTNIPDWMLTMPFWVAHYIDPEQYEPNFKPWMKYDIWQWTDREDGLAHGMESKQVDANYFNGSLEEFKAFCAKYRGEPEPPEPPTPPTLCDEIKRKYEELKSAAKEAVSILSKHL